MTTLSPRYAIEVVSKIRRMLRGYQDAENLAMDDDAKVGLGTAFDEALAVLSELVERADEPVAWMPIETAPKDGTYILVTNEEAGGSWVAKWEPVYVSGFAPENPWMSMMLNTWHLPSRYPSLKPTLWQPLPTAPGASHER